MKAAVPSFCGAGLATSPPTRASQQTGLRRSQAGAERQALLSSPVAQASDELSGVSSSRSRQGADESMRKINAKGVSLTASVLKEDAGPLLSRKAST